MSPGQLEAQREQQESHMKAWVSSRIVPRDALADNTMVDLSPYYDALFGFQNTTNIHSIAPGTHVWDGVKFDVRAKVQLTWQDKQGIKGIPVGRKCSELYFLDGTEWGMPSNTVYKFVIHLAGTNAETFPIVFGRDVANEFVAGHPRQPEIMPTNEIVWQERIRTNAPPQPWRRFYIRHWTNPYPNLPVETVDFVPGQNGNNGYLVAISLKPNASENQ
jgi:hypothetical protein